MRRLSHTNPESAANVGDGASAAARDSEIVTSLEHTHLEIDVARSIRSARPQQRPLEEDDRGLAEGLAVAAQPAERATASSAAASSAAAAAPSVPPPPSPPPDPATSQQRGLTALLQCGRKLVRKRRLEAALEELQRRRAQKRARPSPSSEK
jgi:hypothetical protein